MTNLKYPAVAAVCFGMWLFAAARAQAQTAPAGDQPTQNEDFELNITERRITETPFRRSTQAELNEQDVRLQVGVGASAGRIDVVLRGVTGRVRFHASLESLRRRLSQLRNAPRSR